MGGNVIIYIIQGLVTARIGASTSDGEIIQKMNKFMVIARDDVEASQYLRQIHEVLVFGVRGGGHNNRLINRFSHQW